MSQIIRCDLCKGDILPVQSDGDFVGGSGSRFYGDRYQDVRTVRAAWYRPAAPEFGRHMDAHRECVDKLFAEVGK